MFYAVSDTVQQTASRAYGYLLRNFWDAHHQGMLEAYTNLLRAWDTPQLRDRLRDLIIIKLEHIIDQERGQMKMHFAADWQSPYHNGRACLEIMRRIGRIAY